MIEFVGLPPVLENHTRGCHRNHAISHNPYQNVLKRASFCIQRVSLNDSACTEKALGVQDRSYLNPSPRLIVLCDFPSLF